MALRFLGPIARHVRCLSPPSEFRGRVREGAGELCNPCPRKFVIHLSEAEQISRIHHG
jgi:hypothetical protein